MQKQNNNFGPYKKHCLEIADEYKAEIESLISELVYEVDHKASRQHIFGGQLDKMIEEKMDKIRETIEMRDRVLENKDMFEKKACEHKFVKNHFDTGGEAYCLYCNKEEI